jgi:hypothetical protein
MSGRSSWEAIWAEVHDFLERQNNRPGMRSNRRSISPALPITLFAAIIISMDGWLWLLGAGVLRLVYKVLYDDDWNVSSWWRRKKSIGSHSSGSISSPHGGSANASWSAKDGHTA